MPIWSVCVNLRELVSRHRRCELLALTTHRIVTEATGEFALGAQHFAVQVIAFHVADEQAIDVQLVQVAAAVVQMVEVLASR